MPTFPTPNPPQTTGLYPVPRYDILITSRINDKWVRVSGLGVDLYDADNMDTSAFLAEAYEYLLGMARRYAGTFQGEGTRETVTATYSADPAEVRVTMDIAEETP